MGSCSQLTCDQATLAAHLLGQLTTLSQAAIKAETRLIVQDALNYMGPTDREVLALKHFEQLSTNEIGEVLGMSKAGAGSRYLRVIKRLKEILSQIPGFLDRSQSGDILGTLRCMPPEAFEA